MYIFYIAFPNSPSPEHATNRDNVGLPIHRDTIIAKHDTPFTRKNSIALATVMLTTSNNTNSSSSSSSSSSTMRFIHINEYEYMNNYVDPLQYIILHTRIRICIYRLCSYTATSLVIILMLLTFCSKGSSCMMCDL